MNPAAVFASWPTSAAVRTPAAADRGVPVAPVGTPFGVWGCVVSDRWERVRSGMNGCPFHGPECGDHDWWLGLDEDPPPGRDVGTPNLIRARATGGAP